MKTTLTALAGSVLLLAACNNQTPKTQAEYFPVTTVITVDTSIYTDYVSEIHAIQNVEIRARVSGYLDRIHVDEGVHVEKGQLLFSINNKEYAEEVAKTKAAYKSALAEVRGAELDLKNVKQLVDKQIVSPTELELSKNKLEGQKAKLEEAEAHQMHAQLRFSYTEIRAPFSGIINRIPCKIGSLIEEGSLFTSISGNDEVFAYFDVSEKEYLEYARALQKDSVHSGIVSLILADGKEHTYKGKVETIEGVIDESTGNIAFRARFKNPGRIIRHGASGRVRLHKKFEDVLVVPQKSTFEIQDKLYVYVVDQNNTIQMRNIVAGFRLPHLFIVNQGLQKGESIIYEGIQNVKAGMVIEPQRLSMPSIMNQLAVK